MKPWLRDHLESQLATFPEGQICVDHSDWHDWASISDEGYIRNGADFLLFPELFTLQLLSLVTGTRPGQAARALAEMTPRYLELFTHLAVKYNVNIIGGSQFTVDETGRLENVSYLLVT